MGWPAGGSGGRSHRDALETMIGNLRALANALEAFNNCPPRAFFDTEMLREISKRRRSADAEEES